MRASLLAFACLAGCAQHHVVDVRDGAVRDGGVDARGIDAPGTDAAIDAPGIDGGACRVPVVGVACTPAGGGTFPVGVATTLRLAIEDCHCEGRLVCAAEVVREPSRMGFPGVIEVEPQICDELDCRACTGPTRVACDLPPLSEGRYQIHHRGAPLFELEAGPPGMGDIARCQSASSAGGGLCDFPGVDWLESGRIDTVCFPDPIGAGSAITVRGEVSCAFEPGPCGARLGFDGIHLHPRLRNCDEGRPTWGCEGRSGILERVCPLEDDPFDPVDIRLGGRSIATVTPAGDGPTGPVRCVEL